MTENHNRNLLIPLPRLRNLQVQQIVQNQINSQLELDLLTAAINLDRWTGNRINDDLGQIHHFLQLNKLAIVKEFHFQPMATHQGLNSLQVYEEFIGHLCHLEKLTLSTDQFLQNNLLYTQRLSVLVTTILQNNKDSLTYLQLNGPIGVLPSVGDAWDCSLSKVVTIQMNKGEHGFRLLQGSPIFPPWMSLTGTFPSVQTIKFDSILHVDHPVQSALHVLGSFYTDDNNKGWTKVRRIEMCQLWPEAGLQLLESTFPMLESLAIYDMFDFHLEGRVIWRIFKNIRVLELGICLDTELKNEEPDLRNWGFSGCHQTGNSMRGDPSIVHVRRPYPVQQLDSIFTGFSLGTKPALGRYGDERDTSLVDLKELRILRLTFKDSNDYSEEDVKIFKSFILSEVTGELTFKLMPKLRVFIQVDAAHPNTMLLMKTALKPIEPYVSEVKFS